MNEFLLPSLVIFLLLGSTLTLKSEGDHGFNVNQSKSLKVIAALDIIQGHIREVIEHPKWLLTVRSFSWMEVGIFFFISGYGLSYAYHHRSDFISMFPKRFFRILIPFLVAHIVYMIGDLIFGIPFTPSDIVNSLLGGGTLVKHGWYVPICLLFYLDFWLVFQLELAEPARLSILFVSLWIYVFFSSRVLHLGFYWWRNALSFFGGVCWQYIVARKASKGQNWHKNRRTWLRIACVLLIGFGIGYITIPLSNRVLGVYEYEIGYNLMSLFGVCLIVLLYSKIGNSNRVIEFFAAFTYEIYLYHGFFIDALRSKRVFIQNGTLYVVLVYILTICLSILAHYTMQRIKSAVYV